MKSLFRTLAALILAIGLIAGAAGLSVAQEMATPVPPFDPEWIREFANSLAALIVSIILDLLAGLGS